MLGYGVRRRWSSDAGVCVCTRCAMRERVEGFFWRAKAENRSFGSELSWRKAMSSVEERCVAATVATGIVVVLIAAWLLG
jgi:hypothetical protein